MKRRRPLQSSFPTKVFGLDLRSLATFRIGLALFILYDLGSRSFDLTAHYTDLGVMPRALIRDYYSWSSAFNSLHWVTGSAVGIAALFLIHAVAASGMLLGYRTRLMTFIVWFLLASLHTRNPLVLTGGDDLLRVIFFFAIFLPLGARYSMDAARNNKKKQNARDPAVYCSPASAVYYLQFIAVYFFSALLKTGPEWRSEGTAIYYALNIDQYALPLGKTLLGFPDLLKVLTFAVWWVELLGGFILLIPHSAAKLLGVCLFAGLQLGFAATLELGHFPWVNFITLLPFLPSSIWDRSHALAARTVPRPVGPQTIRWHDAAVIFFFVLVLIYNSAPLIPIRWLSAYTEFPTHLVRLDEYWGMFSPAPTKEDGWYVVEGRLRDGSRVEAFRATRDISYEKPKSAADFYSNDRWRRYMMNIWLKHFKNFRAPFAHYLCSNWNEENSGPDHLEQLSVFFMLEMTPPPGERGVVDKLNLIDHACPR